MILKEIDFKPLHDEIKELLSIALSDEISKAMRHFEILCDANFKCYQANMVVIKSRTEDPSNTQIPSDMELQARIVGEKRVQSKANINKLVSSMFGNKPSGSDEHWMSDDIVYSIGEMLDRISIEFIKRVDYTERNEIQKKASSHEWSSRVKKYLKFKLEGVNKKGFYECMDETRTYDLDNIDDIDDIDYPSTLSKIGTNTFNLTTVYSQPKITYPINWGTLSNLTLTFEETN